MNYREEANAIVANTFRNGFIEDLHSKGKITNNEMKHLMIESCLKMEHLLMLKDKNFDIYKRFISFYSETFCKNWEK